MWQKYYKIAHRQFMAGKFKQCEHHINKALQCAQQVGDLKQIATTYSLLADLYAETENSKASETARQALASAEQAYGADSLEVAEELDGLSCLLHDESAFDEEEAVLQRALKILEQHGQPEQVLEWLDNIVDFYIDLEKFGEAEPAFLRALEMRKRMYGPLSEEVEEEVDRYATILEGLQRHTEAAELSRLLHDCPDCGHGDKRCDELPEVVSILSQVKEVRKGDASPQAIEVLRDAVGSLKQIADRERVTLVETDPFYELKCRSVGRAQRLTKGDLSEVLRRHGQQTQDRQLLMEAADLLRETIKEFPSVTDRVQLTFTLLELADGNDSLYAELEELIEDLPLCATREYTRALMLFVRKGSTTESRAAARDALDQNPYVPEYLAWGLTQELLPYYYSFGSREEAKIYSFEAQRKWLSTRGATDFLIDVMGVRMPASWRRAFDRIAPPEQIISV
jgi:tetratricopeptide (TPR) repeat protein